jgi:hypothetical protein
MNPISYNLKMAAFVALLGFSIYLIKREKNEAKKSKLYLILGAIMFLYFAGKFIEEFGLFPS